MSLFTFIRIFIPSTSFPNILHSWKFLLIVLYRFPLLQNMKRRYLPLNRSLSLSLTSLMLFIYAKKGMKNEYGV